MVNGSIGKILVVDDEIELKNILVEALTLQGYEAAGFSSGNEALAALRGEAFDVLLTDLMMPGMDGITLVRESLQIDPHVICIVMTGQGTIQTAVDAMKEGAFDYVLKPFRLQTVLPILTRAMNTRHMRLENLQLRETVAIYELGQTIAFTLDPQTIISKLADAALQQTDADEVSILLPTSNGEELYVAAVRGENRQRLLGERVPIEESISGWVAREREALILNGEINDVRFRSLCPHPEIGSAISIPMQVANKLVGVININVLSRPRPFTLGQMKALTILASTAAAALESASLYSQVLDAERNYRSIFENAVEGVFRSTSEGRFTTVNPAMARILGYDSPQEMIESITDLAHQLYVDPKARDEAINIEKREGIVRGFEFEAYRKDGTKVWLSANGRTVRDDVGKVIYHEGSIENITERRRAEAALRASEAEMRALFASMTDVIIQFDDQGRHLKIAPTRTPHLYKPAAERIGKTIHEIFPKDKADFFLAQIQQALAKNRTHRVEYSLSINQQEFWYDANISPMTESSVIWVARDITERKQAEEEKAELAAEIENQRRRLDNIISSVPGVVWEAWGQPDAATQQINFVSDYVESMLGYSVEEWQSTPNFWLTIVHPDDRDEAGRVAAASFTTGKGNTQEFRWIAKDGHTVWVESRYVVIADDEGRPAGLRGVNTDITERKRAVEALAKSEERYHALVESLPAMIYYVQADPPYTPLYLNSNIQALGYSTDEWYSKPDMWMSVLHPDDREWVLRETEAAKIAGVDTEYEYRVMAKDGSILWLHDRGRFFTDAHGVRTWQGVILDITERKRAEEVIRESEAKFKELFDDAPVAYHEIDKEGRFTRVNLTEQRLLGYTAEEMQGRFAWEFVVEEVSREAIGAKLSGKAPLQTFERIFIRKDGTLVPMEIKDRLLYDANGEICGIRSILYDITERKRAEEALRESEEKYRTILERMEEGYAEVDLRGTYVFVNDSFCRISDRSRSELLGVNYKELFDREQRQLLFDTYHKVYETGETIQGFEYEVTWKDGTKRVVEESVTLKRDAEGRPIGFTGTRRDCTERKQAEVALRESEERYRDLVENSHEIICTHDLDGKILSVNRATLQLLGYEPTDFINKKTIQDILAPEVRDQFDDYIKEILEKRATTNVMLVQTRSGERRLLEYYNSLRTEGLARPIVRAIARDITERRRAEEALRASEERYRDLVENAHDIIFSHDLKGNYTSVNRAGEQITGYTREECLRLNITDTIAPEHVSKAREMMAKKLAGEKGTEYEVDILAKDGKRVAVEVNTKLTLQNGVPVGVQGIARDMTERKQLEDQLRQSQKMEAIGSLAGGVAHDFNNLLTAINGYSSLALQRIDEANPIKGYLEEIKKAGDRAANLTRQLLAFGRKQILQPVPLNLNDIVTDMYKMLRRLIGEDIELSAKLDSELKTIKADPGQIEQVLVNLVVNARDAMPAGGDLTIETASVELDSEYASKRVGVVPGRYVMLAVSDTGTGMSEATRARIFDPFFTTKEKGKGTGLGLSTVYGIIKQSGGNIWVYSEEERGTTFKVYLPQLETAEKTETPAVESKIPHGSETILLLEDEDMVRSLTRQILESVGYKIIEASRGEEAIKVCRANNGSIDLLLTDVVMPEMSGKEVADRVGELRPSLKVLFMSGYTDEAIVHHGVLDSNVEFIQKPFTPAGLATKVREVLDSALALSN